MRHRLGVRSCVISPPLPSLPFLPVSSAHPQRLSVREGEEEGGREGWREQHQHTATMVVVVSNGHSRSHTATSVQKMRLHCVAFKA